MKKNLKRRDFIKLFLVVVLVILTGCYGTKYVKINQDCCPSIDTKKSGLRIASYNIANVRGNSDSFFKYVSPDTVKDRLDWVVKLVRQFDIDVLCLQEVDFNSIRTNNINMVQYIAEELHYDYIIEDKIFDFPSIMEVGNAVISRHPLKINSSHQYGRTFNERIKHIFKGFLDFEVTTYDKASFNVVLTHLTDRGEETRCSEAETLRAHLLQKNNPFVLLGDFNDTPDSRCLNILTADDLVANPNLGVLTYPSDKPVRSIDHILVSNGLNINNYHAVSMQPSDHLPILGDITFVEK